MSRKLKLERPLVFFDLETTGLNITKDRIIEIALLKVLPDGMEETFRTLVNPEMPIPAESTAVHKISDSDVCDKPTFAEVGKRVAGFIANADLAGYNCNRFDIPMLSEEFYRVGIPVDLSTHRIIDVQVVFHKREQRTLSAAYNFYCGASLEDAHSADADTRATYEVLKGQLEKYDDLPVDVPALCDYTSYGKVIDFAKRLVYNAKGEIEINFGKYKGQLAADVLRKDPGYYSWVLSSDFPQDTKHAFQKIMTRLGNKKI